MKIAMLGHKRVPSREGGIEVVVGELSNRMAKLGHNVLVFNRKSRQTSTPQTSGELPRKQAGENPELIEVTTFHRRGLAAASSSLFATIAAVRRRPDVIHFHAMGPSLMVWIPKLLKVPTVVTIHGLDWQRNKWGRFASWYLRMGERAATKWATEIIVLSQNVRNYYSEEYGRETTYIPNGLSETERKKPDAIHAKYGLEADSYILYVGRIVPEKGVDILVQAFLELETDKRLVIVGDSSDSDEYFEQVRMMASLDPRILMTGFTVGEELTELFCNSYLYVLPSRLEGMPMSLLEAISYGSCCVVSDIKELTEVTGSAAEVVKVGDPESLRRALLALVNGPAAVASYRERSKALAKNLHPWDETVHQTLHVYEAAIENN